MSQCALVKLSPGWNAPQGVDNVHTLCACKPESDDWGNDMYLLIALRGPAVLKSAI